MDKDKTILEEFIDQRGFDNLTVTAIRDLMFKHLMMDKKYKDMSDYDLAIELKVPKRKIAALRCNHAILHSDKKTIKEKAQDHFFNHITKIDGGDTITLMVTDPLLRDYYVSILEENNLLTDYSFNRNILRMPPVSFLALACALKEDEKVDAKVWENEEVSGTEFKNFFKNAEPSFWENLKNDIKAQPVTHILNLFGLSDKFIGVYNLLKGK